METDVDDEFVDTGEESSLAHGEREADNPWPYLNELFEFKSAIDNSCIYQCKLCMPKERQLSTYKNSASNLRKHVQRKHPSKLKKYTDLVATRKRTLEPEKTQSKQAKIPDLVAVSGAKRVPQAKLDKVLIKFICEGLHPFALVEQPAFKELVSTLNPQCTVISRPTLRARIQAASTEMKKAVVSHLSQVRYVATTTDCWSAHQPSQIPLKKRPKSLIKTRSASCISSDEDDFFSSLKSKKSKATSELDGFLACASDKMDLLNSFPLIKKLSLKLNTGLPASAACERLFSCAGLLFTAHRARMDSTNFENQLLLKLNRKFIA